MKNVFVLALLMAGLMSVISCKQNKAEADEMVSSTDSLEAEVKETEPTEPEATELYEPVPPKVDPVGQNGVPSDAIVLFDGSSLDAWMSSSDSTAASWYLNKNGTMTVKDQAGDIETRQHFGSVQLHIEWKSPEEVRREGQNRGNSGIFLSGLYEVQVLDNNNNDTYTNGQVASIYKQHAPLAMASVPSGEWNTYDIIYHAPEFDEDGNKTLSGTISVIHNGVLVQDHVEIKGTTEYIGWPKNPAHGKGPLKLQDHRDDSRVSYRNIWLREL